MLYQSRPLRLEAKTGLALGANPTWEVPRDFPIEAIFLHVTLTPTAAAATLRADGHFNVVKRVQFTGNDGAQNRNIINATGPGLIEYGKNVQGAMDRNTLADIGTNGTAAVRFMVPVWFALPNVVDPVRSMLLLPAGVFTTNPILSVQLGTQADVDSNAAPTFAVAAGITIQPVVYRRQVDIKGQPYFNAEINEVSIPCAANGSQLIYNLPTPGAITGLLYRGFTAAATRGDVAGGGTFNLEMAGTTVRPFTLIEQQVLNDLSVNHCQGVAATNFSGQWFLDFLSDCPGHDTGDFGSSLDTNRISQAGVTPILKYDVTGAGAGVAFNLLYHRVFGDIRPLIQGANLRG